MSVNLLNKASFSEIYHFLEKSGDSGTRQCFKDLFSVALLFFPALMCGDVAAITNLATGATLAGAGIGTIVGGAAKSAFSFFKNKEHGDYGSRYEQMQIAQVLLVYAAYFDTISACLPDENGEIAPSPEVRGEISREALQTYLQGLEKTAQQNFNMPKLLDMELDLPDQTQPFAQYKERLERFYGLLNEEFLKFFEQTAFWKSLEKGTDEAGGTLSRRQAKYFMDLIQSLPKTAVNTYEQQYFALAKEFPDFSVWANRREHARLEAQIDVGFQRIAEELRKLSAAAPCSGDAAMEILARYEKKYAQYITSPIIEYDMGNSVEEIVFPAKRDIFIPQAFQALAFRRQMSLEQADIWKNAFSGQDIGQYISSILRHPKYGELPLLILGLPGAGKTLLCHMLAAQILFSGYHVIIIRLRDTIAEDTIVKQISAQMERDLGEECGWRDIRQVKLDKPVLLIFDGYDELLQASGKTYSDYLNKIAEFQAEQRSLYGVFVRCIVTSRVTLIDKASIPRDSQILRLCDFDNARIQKWSEIWNRENADYFSSRHLEPFEITPSGKLKELAGQPLLLLLLALYEMNGGCLREMGDISRAELYYKLIEDFVRREKEKDAAFKNLPAERRDAAVQRDFWRLGVAAMGMYNRRKLFIQTKELNKDLAFLTGASGDDTDECALGEGDKLVGSFFFIHSSESVAQVNGKQVRTSAYEFLHNTFGEFLTAYCVLDTVFQLIRRQRVEAELGEPFSWPEGLKKRWHAALAYAPLFSRPVVLNMIHELSFIFARERGLTAGEVQGALDALFHDEIQRVITGEAFADLHGTLNMQENPYKHPELMIHMAAYSVNLVLLRATVCTSSFAFTEGLGSGDDWRKLTCIWRYGFSEEELAGMSGLFETEHADGGYTLTYMYDEEAVDRAGMLSRMEKLRRVSGLFAEDALYAALCAFDYPMSDDIREAVRRERLPLRTKYALNEVYLCLSSVRYAEREQLMWTLHELFCSCVDERDVLGLYTYCALLRTLAEQKYLSQQNMSYLLNAEIFNGMDHVLMNTDKRCIWAVMIFQEILDCVKFMVGSEKFRFLPELGKYFEYESRRSTNNFSQFKRAFQIVFLRLCKTVWSALENCQPALYRRSYQGICLNILQEAGMGRHHFDSLPVLGAILEICGLLRKKYSEEESNVILERCFGNMGPMHLEKIIPRNIKNNAALLGSAIDCCYYMAEFHSRGSYEENRDVYLEILFRRAESFSTLLPEREEQFYHLLCLLLRGDFLLHDLNMDWLREGLHYIVRRYGEELAVRTLRKVAELGYQTGWQELCDEVQSLASLIR